MQYSPPPLFKQGASARAKVVFFTILAIFLLVIDSRLKALVFARQVVATALYPVQMLALMPRDAALNVSHHFASTAALGKENDDLKRQQILNAQALQQNGQLLAENTHLRKLIDARERMPVKSIIGEILYDTRDPATHKIILNRGIQHGVALSQPVIDELGVVGQVTRVFPLTSEVTLLTDKNQAIPVQILRNGLRSVVYGRGQSGQLDMRMTTNADVQNGDVLVTSGIDGVYPEGLAVGKVANVENKATTTFENILCIPAAGIAKHRQLLILLVETNNLPRPDTEEVRVKKEKLNRKVTRDAAIAPAASNDAAASNTVPAMQTTSVMPASTNGNNSTNPTNNTKEATGLSAAPASAAKTTQSNQSVQTIPAPQAPQKMPK